MKFLDIFFFPGNRFTAQILSMKDRIFLSGTFDIGQQPHLCPSKRCLLIIWAYDKMILKDVLNHYTVCLSFKSFKTMPASSKIFQQVFYPNL